jgi:hypothetical protein
MNLLRTGFVLFIALSVSVLAIGQSSEEFAHHNQPEMIRNVQVYPNPSVDYLFVKFETPIAKTVKLVVHSIIGNEIEVEKDVVDEFEVRVKVKDLNTGFYILSATDQANNAKGTFKFLKR